MAGWEVGRRGEGNKGKWKKTNWGDRSGVQKETCWIRWGIDRLLRQEVRNPSRPHSQQFRIAHVASSGKTEWPNTPKTSVRRQILSVPRDLLCCYNEVAANTNTRLNLLPARQEIPSSISSPGDIDMLLRMPSS
jgi:hypothetical protein